VEEFVFVDLFATKGIEYIVVIGMLLVFVPFWIALHRSSRPAPREAEIPSAATLEDWFRLPEHVYYHPGHTWARPEEADTVRVGMDDFSKKMVGRISAIRAPAVGDAVVQGKEALTLEVDSKNIEMLSPVDGEVVEVNREAIENPERISADPYGDAWLLKVRVPETESNLKNLLSGDLARLWMGQVTDTLRERAGLEALGTVYQDGGVPVEGMARSIDPRNWDEIVRAFFQTT
jgi:glycine cleavage system H protein